MTDIDIARAAEAKPIQEIASALGINADKIEPYGHDKAKLPLSLMKEDQIDQSKMILVTAISPTPAGEGKTTTSVGLLDGLAQLGQKAAAALREPSLGPVFGIKGGAAGGGHSQVIPMEDLNLHFTGDFAAVEKANNLLSAMIDNNLQSKTRSIGLDPRSVMWKRVMDMNDRSLRNIITGIGGKTSGMPREAGFDITAASEVMAILSMSKDIDDLRERFNKIYIGDTFKGDAVLAKEINASEAMTILMKDAIMPNLVQTLENNPVFIHAGPFANIAQGTNSLIATKMAMSYADWVVTEAGFGSDLGAEKFFNIKCRTGEIAPRAVVLVATVKALKYHGGVSLKELGAENVAAVKAGLPNLERHLESLQKFGAPVVVSINAFSSDTDAEIDVIAKACEAYGVRVVRSEGWAKGGKGTTDLAQAVMDIALDNAYTPNYTYNLEDSIEDKIHKICTEIYGADGVDFSNKALKQLRRFEEMGYSNLPICMAKTPKSFTDNDKVIGRPTGFRITVREFQIAAGAGFIIPITGAIMRMPGLPATPAAEGMSIDKDGIISGLS